MPLHSVKPEIGSKFSHNPCSDCVVLISRTVSFDGRGSGTHVPAKTKIIHLISPQIYDHIITFVILTL